MRYRPDQRLSRRVGRLGTLVVLAWLGGTGWHSDPTYAAGPSGTDAAATAPGKRRDTRLPRLKRGPDGQLVPDVPAAAVAVYSPETGQILWEENAHAQRSIASITKVMTALVFLEEQPDLRREVQVVRSDVRRASTTYLRNRERISLKDVLHLALIVSDNAAARVLARVSSLGSERFVERMTEKAQELGLESTRFAEPSGLDADNVSSAYDLSRLIVFAVSDERIAMIMRKPTYTLRTNRRRLRIRNTNRMLQRDVMVRGGKTGYISKAGYCLASLVTLPQGEQVAVVLLGARSNTARFQQTHRLLNWLAQTVDGRPTASN